MMLVIYRNEQSSVARTQQQQDNDLTAQHLNVRRHRRDPTMLPWFYHSVSG
jgi:hypothetical protein